MARNLHPQAHAAAKTEAAHRRFASRARRLLAFPPTNPSERFATQDTGQDETTRKSQLLKSHEIPWPFTGEKSRLT